MFARYLDRKLVAKNIKVKCFSTHPGVVKTDLFIHSPLHNTIIQKFWKNAHQGAITILFACFSTTIENMGGLFISNCKEGISSPLSKNEEVQKKLFEESCKMLSINNFGDLDL